MARPSNYSPELRARAVRMVAELTPDYPSQYAAITAVARKLGIGTAETLRKWVRRAEVNAGQRPGTTSAEHAEIKRLRRENAELRRANEILKASGVSLRPSWTGHRAGDRVHLRAQGPPGRWSAVGCRADLRGAE